MRYKSYRYYEYGWDCVTYYNVTIITYLNPAQLFGEDQGIMTVCFKDWSSMGKGIKDSKRQTWHQTFANHRKEHKVRIRNKIVRGKRDWEIPVIVLC